MNNLFYTTDEKICFWVAGYRINKGFVQDQIEYLKKDLAEFVKMTGCIKDEVSAFYNQAPPRYQYMEIYWTIMDAPPKGAVVYGEGWTMRKVITS